MIRDQVFVNGHISYFLRGILSNSWTHDYDDVVVSVLDQLVLESDEPILLAVFKVAMSDEERLTER